MKQISYLKFEELMAPIEKYNVEYEDASSGLKLLCTDSYAVPSLGCALLSSYMDLLESYLELDIDWLSWFVFENEYGLKGLEAQVFGVEYKITCLEDFYNLLTKF